MLEIALVADEHDDNVGVCVVLELFKPTLDIVKCGLFGDVIDEQGADCAAVISRSDGAIAFLTSGIPNLCLYGLALCLNGSGGKLDANGGFRFEVELVASKATQQV